MPSVIDFLAFSCVHIPINHKASTAWLIEQVRARRPRLIVSLGDLFDCAALSKYEGWREASLDEEYEEGAQFLDDLYRASPKSTLVTLDGNHEQRGEREENKKFGSLVSWQRHCKGVLSQFKRHIYRPYRNSPKGLFSIGQVTFCHGFSNSDSAIRLAAYAGTVDHGLFCYGHTHRPHDANRVRLGAKTWLRLHYANPGTFVDPAYAKDGGYAQTFDTSLWACSILAGTVDHKRKHAGSQLWTCDRIICPVYPEVA